MFFVFFCTQTVKYETSDQLHPNEIKTMFLFKNHKKYTKMDKCKQRTKLYFEIPPNNLPKNNFEIRGHLHFNQF